MTAIALRNTGGPWRAPSGAIVAHGEQFSVTAEMFERMTRRHQVGTRFERVEVKASRKTKTKES